MGKMVSKKWKIYFLGIKKTGEPGGAGSPQFLCRIRYNHFLYNKKLYSVNDRV